MIGGVDDVIATYRAASERGDVEALMTAIAPDAELVSPLSGRMVFRGSEDLRVLFDGVYSTLRDLHWTGDLGDDRTRVLLGSFKIGPFRGTDAMVLELGTDGLISRVRPHLRPWLPTSLFALVLGPKLARRPGILMRALR